MKMTKEKNLEKLNAGDFKIEHEEFCNCQFDWDIRDGGQLNDGVEGNERGESINNEIHEARRRAALISWLMENNYYLDRDDKRGFANEYTMILRESRVEESPISLEAAEKWADEYLYRGDAITAAFVSFKMEYNNLYT